MRRSVTGVLISGVLMTAPAVLASTGPAQAADADPVYTCQTLLVDSINRVAGDGCTGSPADYEGAGTIKSADSGTGWQCALLKSGPDPDRPGKLIVVGLFGCEQPDNGITS
ncbi:hypothetical protein [Streptomyces sp. NPDC056796]|uniref:hypothetical protein n=1 Tax=unclassified Streptomyces TaxID=2593676 RepID=UPI00367BF866